MKRASDMKRVFDWKQFVISCVEDFDYDSFEDFVEDMYSSVGWVDNLDGRSIDSIIEEGCYEVSDSWCINSEE